MGIHAVSALFQPEGRPVESLTIAKGAGGARIQALVDQARQQGIRVRFVERHLLDEMVGGVAHQGVMARAGLRRQPTFDQLLSRLQSNREPLLLLLDGVEDPHNLGAIVRSAESFGAQAVILPKDRSAALSTVAAKAASGAAERMDVVRVTNLSRTMMTLKEQGFRLVGLTVDAESSPLSSVAMSGPLALVLGSEEKGLRRLTREQCDLLVSIPITGGVGSLNVSVAAGVALYEVWRSRRQRAADLVPSSG